MLQFVQKTRLAQYTPRRIRYVTIYNFFWAFSSKIAYALPPYLTIFFQLSLFLVNYLKNISGGKITAQCVGGLTGKFFSKKRKDNCTDGAERKDNCRKDNCAGGVY